MSYKLLPLKDNALFLQNYRERNRRAILTSAIIIAVIIISLLAINAYINPTPRKYTYAYGKMRPHMHWSEAAFYWLSILQGILLLFIGTLSANRMASRERRSGTLDFHRASPTSRLNQTIGMVLGAPSLEWIIFFGSTAVAFIFVAFSPLPLLAVLKFYAGLILCALFYHSLAVLLGIWNTRTPNASPIGGFKLIAIFILFTIIANFQHSFPLSGLYYIGWSPFYKEIEILVMGTQPNHYSLRHYEVLHSFFGLRGDPLLLQFFVQFPLIGLTWTGIARKISRPERPVLSKGQSAVTTLFILFLFVGSAVSAFYHYESKSYHWVNPVQFSASYFIIITLLFGIAGALAATPSQPLFLKGLRRAKRLKRLKVNPNDDHSTNIGWLATVSFVITVMYFMIAHLFPAEMSYKLISLIIILSFITFFACALEHFRLSNHHKKASFFITGLSILWVFLPILGFITGEVVDSPYYIHFFLAGSPFFGLEPIIKALQGNEGLLTYGIGGDTVNLTDFKLFVSLFINAALAIVMALLATRQRHRLFNQVFKHQNPKQ